MSVKFYTNVQNFGNYILYRGVIDGKQVRQRVKYAPSLYINSTKPTEYTTLDGSYLTKKEFKDIRGARDYIKQFKDVANASKIYGNTRYEYAFIADQHRDSVPWDASLIHIAILDIEVGSENGFPDPYIAKEPITAIGIKRLGGTMVVFACGEYEVKGDELYVKCKNEKELAERFLMYWGNHCPDIITGWNTKFFDIPYLVNRFTQLLDEEQAKQLSPWGFINERKTFVNNREMKYYELIGVASLDYMDMYKGYAKNGISQENYRLETIAQSELKEGKLSFDEYDNLHQLYKLDFQKFIEYNIKDIVLIERLDDKLKLFDIAMTLAYDTKCNFEDIFTQTRMWDALTYSYLLKDNIIVPPKSDNEKDAAYDGAYVKEVQVGAHNYVVSFDLDSLYPHLIMQYNISPETLIRPGDYTQEMHDIIAAGVTVEKLLNKEIDTSKLVNCCITPNGEFFRTDIQGFLPKMMSEMYANRKMFKGMMLEAEQEYENEKDTDKLYEIEKRISKYKNLQTAKKLSLNSAYGAFGSQYFRFFDIRIALSITAAGQLSIKWIENKINGYMNNLLKTNTDYVIAMDTDSVYLKLGPLVEKVYGANGKVPENMNVAQIIDFMDKVCKTKIQPFIDKSYGELAEYVRAYEQKMRMKRECLADRGIWTAKKRYVMNVYDSEGVRYNEPELKIVGLQMVQSSTPVIVRKKLKDSVKIMISGTQSDMHDFIRNFKDEFKTLPPEEIARNSSVNGIKKYSHPVTLYGDKTPMAVKGSILYNHYLKVNGLDKKYQLIQEGEKVKYVQLKTPNPFKDIVVSFPARLPKELDLDGYIDYNTQFEKTFLEPIKSILDCMGWTTEKKSSLEDFFT